MLVRRFLNYALGSPDMPLAGAHIETCTRSCLLAYLDILDVKVFKI